MQKQKRIIKTADEIHSIEDLLEVAIESTRINVHGGLWCNCHIHKGQIRWMINVSQLKSMSTEELFAEICAARSIAV